MMFKLLSLLKRLLFSWGFLRFALAVVFLAGASLFIFGFGSSDTDRLIKNNPEAQAYIDALKSKEDARTIEAAAHYYMSRYCEDGGSRFVRDLSRGNDAYVKLSRTLVKVGNELSDEQLDNLARLTACADCLRGEASEVALELLDNSREVMLKAKSEGGKTWDAVKNDPVAALLYSECSTDAAKAPLWNTYCQYDEVSWAVPLIAQLDVIPNSEANPNGELSAESHLGVVLKFIDLCGRYPSLRLFVSDLKKSLEEGDEANFTAEQVLLNLALAYDVYTDSAEEMESICSRSIKPAVALDIVALNRDLLEKARAEGSSESFCQAVVDLCHSGNEYLVYAAQQLPGFLDLYRLSPRDVAAVKVVYWESGALPLLYSACKDENGTINEKALLNGVKALASPSSDLAMWAFSEESLGGDAERFATVLALDWRVVPFLSKHGTKGLRGLYENPESYLKLLNDELTADGRPKAEPWTKYIPLVGSTVKTVSDFVKGMPFDAESAAWAAWEAADVGLMVASGGTSKGISTVLKSAAKSQIKKEGQRQVKRQVVKTSLGKTAARASGSSGYAAKFAGALAGKKALSVLTRVAVPIGKYSYRITKGAAGIVGKTGKWLLAHPRVCRVLAWSMLGTEVAIRTVPKAAQFVREVIAAVVEMLNEQVEAVKKTFKEMMPSFFAGSSILNTILRIFLLVLALCIALYIVIPRFIRRIFVRILHGLCGKVRGLFRRSSGKEGASRKHDSPPAMTDSRKTVATPKPAPEKAKPAVPTLKICFLGATQAGKTTFMQGLYNPDDPGAGRMKTVFSDTATGDYLKAGEATATTTVRRLDGVLEFSDGKEITINFIDLPGEWFTQIYRDKDKSHAALELIRPFVNECQYLYFFLSPDDLKDESALRACVGVVDDYKASTGEAPFISIVLTKCDLVPELKELENPDGKKSRKVKGNGEALIRKCIRTHAGDSAKQLKLLESKAKRYHYSCLCVQPGGTGRPHLPSAQFDELFSPLYRETYTVPLLKGILMPLCVLLLGAIIGVAVYTGIKARNKAKIRGLEEQVVSLENKTFTNEGEWERFTRECDDLLKVCEGSGTELFALRERLKTRKSELKESALKMVKAEYLQRCREGQYLEAGALKARYETIAKAGSAAGEAFLSAPAPDLPSMPPELKDIHLLDAICNIPPYNSGKGALSDHLLARIDAVDKYLKESSACTPLERTLMESALKWARVFQTDNTYELIVKLTGGWDDDFDMACIAATDSTTGSSDEPYDNVPSDAWMSDNNRFTAHMTITWKAGMPIRVSVYVNPALRSMRRVGTFYRLPNEMSIKYFCNKTKQKFNWSYEAKWTDPFSESDVMSMEYSFEVKYKGTTVTPEIVSEVEKYFIFDDFWRQKRDEAYKLKREFEEEYINGTR